MGPSLPLSRLLLPCPILRSMFPPKISKRLADSDLRQSLAVAFLVLSLGGAAVVWTLTSKAPPPLRSKDVPLVAIIHRHSESLEQYPESFPVQVAVFWTNPSPEPENPLPLVHALKEMGIPFFITRDLGQALRHRLVILYPSVDAQTFTEAQAGELTAFVQQGGFIFAQNVFWGGMESLFGFRSFAPSRKRYHLALFRHVRSDHGISESPGGARG